MKIFLFSLICFLLLHGCSNFDDEIGLECKHDETARHDYKFYSTEKYLVINKSTKVCTEYDLPLRLADNGEIYFTRYHLGGGRYNQYDCLQTSFINKQGNLQSTEGGMKFSIDRTSLKAEQSYEQSYKSKAIKKYQLLKCELIPIERIKSRIDRKVKTFTDKRKI